MANSVEQVYLLLFSRVFENYVQNITETIAWDYNVQEQ